MSDPFEPTLDNCGCCEPAPAPTAIYNRPGLPALSYRAGTYGTIFRRMLNRIGTFTLQDGDFAGTRPLSSLTTREQDDPSIALLDASAVVADVLTFYQERIANEGFLRTATERRSILEMAREIGYELSPGVAASVYLSFLVDDAQGAPGVSSIPLGTKVQSIPPQGKLPQPFETSQELVAYKEWNALRPRLSYPQQVSTSTKRIYLQGTGNNVRVGGRLLVDSGSQAMLRAVAVELQAELQRTRVDFSPSPSTPAYLPVTLPQGKVDINTQVALDENAINTHIRNYSWTNDDLNAFLSFNQWDQKKLLTYLENDRKTNPSASGSVHAFRSILGLFGNTAPLYSSLKDGDGVITYPGQDWDAGSGWQIWKYQQTGNYYQQADIYLERVVQELTPESWVCLEAIGADTRIYKISSIIERSVTAFALNSKLSGLILKTPAGASLNDTATDKPEGFTIRVTNAYLQSEKLTLAELPLGDALDPDPAQLELNGLALGLHIGQAVALSGERLDAPGVTASEILIIKDINHVGGFTVLTFLSGRQYSYKRDTLTINANTVAATHGETVNEILGSGDGAQAHQKFTLKKPPLTHIPAPTPSGSASTLQLRVDNLLWDEAASLYELGSKDQAYIIRIDDPSTGSGQAATASVIFGDGNKGARLPSGENNITATYRSGIGLEGQVDAGSLTLLPVKPFGVRGVTNPLAASGAGDPEKMEAARDNAPLTVRTLNRIVSREDYQDFAAAFAGIGKAQAVDLWSGEYHLVHVTIAGEDGKPVEAGQFRDNFIDALEAARDPSQQARVDTFELLLFNLTANVSVDSRYISEDVFAAVQTALQDAFAFEQRTFGQPVTAAEIITVIQKVEGVVYVDLDALYLSSDSSSLNQILLSRVAHVKDGAIQKARLLLLNSLGVQLQEVLG
jgi:hypothetical protein